VLHSEAKAYRCLPQQRFERAGYEVSPVQPEHIERIRVWRNAQLTVLRQRTPIEPGQQEQYYAGHVWPTMTDLHPPNVLMAYAAGTQVIGYGGLVHIAWLDRRAELSFLLSPDRGADSAQYASDFSAFIALMREVAFSALGLHRLFTETFATRRHHISVLEAAGFRREGTLRDHVCIDGTPTDSLLHGCLDTDVLPVDAR